LDEIAWVLNLRGTDVLYNPIFYAYLIIEVDKAILFVNPEKLSAQDKQTLFDDKISILNYDCFYSILISLPYDSVILADPKKTNMLAIDNISDEHQIKKADSIITDLKAIKNKTEIENIRQTMIKDGVAMVKFLTWLNNNKNTETELSASEKLTEFRKEQEGFVGESFETISSYGEHGAIVHYSVTPETDISLQPKGIYLVDSGGQYNTGTTDITRTIALGAIPEQAKTDYTLVLKGHIALASAIFPEGTRGTNLDILARKSLWETGLNYGHGTGHGIGYYLNVHEGPQSIRQQENPATIKVGMVTSNEPGLYRSGEYGIRIENLIL
jgi:Xaa-Pro aminopeptidase